MPVCIVKLVQPLFAQQYLQTERMGLVEIVLRRPIVPEVEHHFQRQATKPVCNLAPVAVEAVTLPGLRKGFPKAGMPIQQSAAGIKSQRLDAREAHGIRTVAPNVLPDSIASCALTASCSAYS